MEELKDRVREFLATDDGNDGCGFGSGCGDAVGNGSGSGSGCGSGFGGFSMNCGDGSGSGPDSRCSSRYSSGRTFGYSYGSGRGHGSKYSSGHGSGLGDGIAVFVGKAVHDVDGVQTIITAVNAGFAKGYILNSDLTLTPCYIAKGGGIFAHGATLNKAVAALQAKLFQDMPEEARISAFIKAHPDKNAKIPARDLWVWHNRLTGSCEMGRNQFAADRGIDIDKDEFTPLEFCELCKGSYGGDVIRRLEEAYAV